MEGDKLVFRGLIASPDGKLFYETTREGKPEDAVEMGNDAGMELKVNAMQQNSSSPPQGLIIFPLFLMSAVYVRPERRSVQGKYCRHKLALPRHPSERKIFRLFGVFSPLLFVKHAPFLSRPVVYGIRKHNNNPPLIRWAGVCLIVAL